MLVVTVGYFLVMTCSSLTGFGRVHDLNPKPHNLVSGFLDFGIQVLLQDLGNRLRVRLRLPPHIRYYRYITIAHRSGPI